MKAEYLISQKNMNKLNCSNKIWNSKNTSFEFKVFPSEISVALPRLWKPSRPLQIMHPMKAEE